MSDVAYREARGFDYRKAFLYALFFASLPTYLFYTNEWVHWPYMLSAYAIGACVWFWERRRDPDVKNTPLPGYLFPKKIWLHPSSINDGLIALIIFAVVILPLQHRSFVWYGTVAAISHLFPSYAIFHPEMPKPPFWAIAAYTVASIVLGDLFYYISHRIQHDVPALWEFHKVHHSAEVMTPLTLYRLHPVDWILTSSLRQVGTVVAALVFLHFYPGARSLKLVFGIGLAINLPVALSGSLRHSHIWLSFGRFIEHVLVSPAMHQIHHSIHPDHVNRNYGSLFSLWDWMFNSLYLPKGKENLTLGLAGKQMIPPYRSAWGLCFHPFRAVFRKALARYGGRQG